MHERCASKTFSVHQSLSLCSVPQQELRRGHQLSLSVWAGLRFEPSLSSSQPRLISSLSVAAHHRPSLSNTVRRLKVRVLNGVLRLKGELESSASLMVLCAFWESMQMEWRRDIHIGRTRKQNVFMAM